MMIIKLNVNSMTLLTVADTSFYILTDIV